MNTWVQLGKAFEYALALQIAENIGAALRDDDVLLVAKGYYNQVDPAHIDQAATEAAIFLQRHDERMDNVTSVRLQSDIQGKLGDVRDIVLTLNGLEIGISAKHNHQAVKHSRLSDKIDFGKAWGDHPVSGRYWKAINPIFEDMRNRKGQLFRDIPNKEAVYYLPILTAFEDELRRLCEDFGRQFTKPVFQYLLGKHDYYKVVCQKRCVYVQSTNINGTLKWGRKWRIPERIEQIRRKPGSNSTLLVSFSGGWQLSFRLHNARSKVEPSLKFDIQFVGLPQSVARHEIPLV